MPPTLLQVLVPDDWVLMVWFHGVNAGLPWFGYRLPANAAPERPIEIVMARSDLRSISSPGF